MSIIKEDKPFTKIYVIADACAIQAVPDQMQGIPVEKVTDVKRMKSTEALFGIRCISVIKYEVKLSIVVAEQKGKKRVPLEDGIYVFTYHYDPERQVYVLRRIKSGILL